MTSSSYSAYQPMLTGSTLVFLSTLSGAENLFSLPLDGEIPTSDSPEAQMQLAPGPGGSGAKRPQQGPPGLLPGG